MKRIVYIFWTVVLLGLNSCSSIDSELGGVSSLRGNHIKRIFATTEQNTSSTKVYADEQLRVLWNEGDLLSVFNQSTYNSRFEFAGEDGDNAGDFDDVTPSGLHSGNPLSNIYAVYPYDKGNKINNDGNTITLTLPAEQQYKEHSFGIGANTMIAVTDNDFLAFKNLGGYLQLRLYGDDVKVSSITIQGNNGEKIAGKASVAVALGAMPTVTMDATATDAITLVCDPAVELGTTAEQYTDFWFVIPPVTFEGGFTITVTDELGGVFQKTTTKSLTISRSTIEWMSALEVTPNYDNAYVAFEDANFKAYCVENFDTNHNGEISMSEAELVTKIIVNPEIVASLAGIEYFKNLLSLDCSLVYHHIIGGNDGRHFYNVNNEEIFSLLTTLDVSKNTALEDLRCRGNQLTGLVMGNNNALQSLNCECNQLMSLDVSNCTTLTTLCCSNNQLASLDVSKNTELARLECQYNQLTSLDVSKNTALTYLNCDRNQLTSLDVSKNTALQELSCEYNQLTSLEVNNNTALTLLLCDNNQLTSLAVSKDNALKYLNCSRNMLTSLDVSKNTALVGLYCYINQLTSLDVSKNTTLTTLCCYNNQLASLDVSKNTELARLECQYNQLTSLDVSNNTSLSRLYCYSNPFLKEIWLKSGQTITYLQYDTDIATIKYKTSLYCFERAYALPDYIKGSVVDYFEARVDSDRYSRHQYFKETAGSPDSMIVFVDETNKDNFKNIVDSIWYGLNSVYEDMSSSGLFDVDIESVKADQALLEKYAKSARGKNDSLRNILSRSNTNASMLLDAWVERVTKDCEDIPNLAKKVDEYTNYEGRAEYNIYRYEDRVLSTDGQGPRVILNYDTSSRIITQAADDETHFILDAVDTPWYDVQPARALTIAPTEADSLLVFNAIKAYFTAVDYYCSVPYLKFINTTSTGQFFIDSVRANKIDFSGLKMKRTNSFLDGIGIHRAALYDNKGVNNVNNLPSDASGYVDAFTNLIDLFNHYVHYFPLTLPLYNARDASYYESISVLQDCLQYVNDFKRDNSANTLDGYRKIFYSSNNTYYYSDFSKYTRYSYEGIYLANWMDACEKYYGVDGFAGFGEQLFFTKDTFTNPNNLVIFDGVPSYNKNAWGGITSINRVDVVKPGNYQFAAVANTIRTRIEPYNATYYYDLCVDADDYVDNFMVMKSSVFETIEADYLVAIAKHDKSPRQVLEELGEILSQVKADLDAVTAE